MFPGFLLNPWVWLGVITALASSCGTGYVAGRKHEANSWKAEQAEQLAAQIKEKEAYEELARGLVKRVQEKEAKANEYYRKWRGEVGKVTSGRQCFDAGAVSLWNEALAGEDHVPGTSAGAAAASGATDTAVLNNHIDNAGQYAECRRQLNALIDWHEREN
jgi:hypothetical protein